MRILLVFALFASAACAGQNHALALSTTAASLNIHTATNPGASFEAYRTFSFGSSEGAPAGYPVPARSAEVQRRLQPLIAAVLTQKGYVPATEKGDIFIMFGSGAPDASTNEPAGAGGGWLADDESADFVEGSLVVDGFDGTEGHWVWHGASRANINPDRIDDQLLQRSVQELLSSFPTAATK